MPAAGSLIRAGDVSRLVATPATSAVTSATTTTTEVKDSNVGDYTFTAVSGHTYRVKYQCRAASTVAQDKVDVRIRDGGGSSPTNTSTLVAGAETTIASASVALTEDLKVEQLMVGLSAGTHIIAAFFLRAAGTGNVSLGQATGQTRELYVEDMNA